MMRRFSLAETAGWLSASAPGVTLDYTGVSTDTRKIQPGELYVALRGERFDGHQFLAEARSAGAVAAVVDTRDKTVDLPQIQVADTLQALATLAASNRNESDARVVAITGSSGKTTVKEMVAAILARAGATLATIGNLNNHIGVPLTLFRLAPEHRFGVIELGASGLGEIAHTVAITRPRVAILTNAGEAHLEGFGSYENIVQAKGEIIDGVSADGLVVLNADDPAFAIWQARAGQRRVMAVSGQGNAQADYWHEAITAEQADDVQSFRAHGPEQWQCDIRLPMQGAHNVTNALLAIAAAREFGLADQDIQASLAALVPVSGRLQVLVLTPELTVIDDSYNANPTSMKAALGVLAQQPGTRIAVLGAMAELGPESRRLHRDVGATAKTLGIERLLTVGSGCEGYGEGFGKDSEACTDHGEAIARVITQKAGPVAVLVKGSRSSAMDRVVEGIKEKVNNTCCSG